MRLNVCVCVCIQTYFPCLCCMCLWSEAYARVKNEDIEENLYTHRRVCISTSTAATQYRYQKICGKMKETENHGHSRSETKDFGLKRKTTIKTRRRAVTKKKKAKNR